MTNKLNVCDTCAFYDWWYAECMLDEECNKFTTFATGKEVLTDEYRRETSQS